MLPSIPDGSWRVKADNPMALTQLLDLPGLRVTGLEYDDVQETLHVFCEHPQTTARCPTCQQSQNQIPQYANRAIRDLPWAAKPCLRELVTRRFYCENCVCPFREELEWLPRSSRLTARYRQFVFEQCRRTSVQAVAFEERLGCKTVERLYYALARQQADTLPAGQVRLLGIDEFAVKKGHAQFASALSDLEAGRILAVLPDRNKETREACLSAWTKEQRDAVEEVAMDLWQPYAQAVTACLPQARIVADRFHGMKNLTDPLSAARREIQRGVSEAARLTLKGCRWLLVRNEADLSDADKQKLSAMFALAPDLQRLHRLKEDFRAVFETTTGREEAASRLENRIQAVQSSGLTKLMAFVETLQGRWEHILNCFPNRLSSGKVEGLNNKVKVVKRCAYGFRNFAHFALRILTECDGAK